MVSTKLQEMTEQQSNNGLFTKVNTAEKAERLTDQLVGKGIVIGIVKNTQKGPKMVA